MHATAVSRLVLPYCLQRGLAYPTGKASPKDSNFNAFMMSFAIAFGTSRGAFTREGFSHRCLGQAANLQRKSLMSTVNNARLWYLKPLDLYQTEKPYHINLPVNALGSHAQSNEVSQEYAGIRIQSLRGFESCFTLDKNGFQVFQDTDCSDASDWSTRGARAAPGSDVYSDPALVRENYYPAVERFLKEKLGARLAKAFTHDVWQPPCSPGDGRGDGHSLNHLG